MIARLTRSKAARTRERRAIGGLALLALAALAPAGLAQAQPAAGDALDAFAQAESWLRDWRPPGDDARDPVGAQGASVALRLDGATLGRGTWQAGSPASQSAPGSSLARAFTLALREAQVRAPVPRDALRDEALRQLAQRMTLDVQLAGPLTPIDAADWTQAALALSPGLDGVAGRVGDQLEAVFPGTMLAANLPMEGALRAVAGGLDLPPEDLATLRDRHGLTLYRFRVRHLAQLRPGEPAVFLHRGGRVKPIESVAPEALRTFARELAANLMARVAKRDEQPLGVYRPWTGGAEPSGGSDAVPLALAALALARSAADETGAAQERALASAASALAALLPRNAPVRDEARPPPESAWIALLALDAIRQASASVSLDAADTGAIAQALAEAVEATHAGDKATAGEAGGESSIAVDALRACALTAWAQPALRVFVAGGAGSGDDAAAIASASSAALAQVRRQSAAGGDLTPAMPWLAWAIFLESQDQRAIPAAAALREHRELVFAHQLTRLDLAFEDRDLAGGVVFTKGGAALPTWRTAQAIVAPAMMLGDRRLTEPAELPRETLRLLRSLRFLRQLQADEAAMHMFEASPLARGGIRAAPWDQRMPVEATALTLLAAAETIKALRERADDAPAP